MHATYVLALCRGEECAIYIQVIIFPIMDNETFHSCTNWWTRPLLHAILHRSWSAGGGKGGGGVGQFASTGQSLREPVKKSVENSTLRGVLTGSFSTLFFDGFP